MPRISAAFEVEPPVDLRVSRIAYFSMSPSVVPGTSPT
jgi:hypothetical protein